VRSLNRIVAGSVVGLTLGVTAGCTATPSTLIDSVPGRSLEFVDDHVGADITFLIQDVSPRVGLPASYQLERGDDLWTVVAVCANSASLGDATSVEVAVIPKKAFTAEVTKSMKAGAYRGSVDCASRKYRA
jgi:hypothetical protein